MNNKEIEFMNILVSLLDQQYDIESILKLCSSLHFHKECEALTDSLKKGNNLGEAILQCHFSDTFKEYFLFFKNTFSISDAVRKTVTICEKRNKIKKMLISKLTYPCCLLLFLFVFSIFIITFLLPQVENLFTDFQIEKGMVITIMFIIFHFIPYLIFFLFLTALTLFLYVYINIKRINYKVIDMLIAKTHFISMIIKKYYSLKFALYYDEMLKNHYDATTIVEILYEKINDSDIRMIIYELHHFIISGESINDAISHFPYFEKNFKIFYLMMSQNRQFKSLNDYIEIVFMQINHFLSQFIRITVPLIYGFTAAFVIVVYISIIIPMMNVITNL